MFIAEYDERKQEFRCQVVREQPFRSTSNDVTQATDRCNVDYQFLPCAPPLPPDADGSNASDAVFDIHKLLPMNRADLMSGEWHAFWPGSAGQLTA